MITITNVIVPLTIVNIVRCIWNVNKIFSLLFDTKSVTPQVVCEFVVVPALEYHEMFHLYRKKTFTMFENVNIRLIHIVLKYYNKRYLFCLRSSVLMWIHKWNINKDTKVHQEQWNVIAVVAVETWTKCLFEYCQLLYVYVDVLPEFG